jgi:hypothetical protein
MLGPRGAEALSACPTMLQVVTLRLEGELLGKRWEIACLRDLLSFEGKALGEQAEDLQACR